MWFLPKPIQMQAYLWLNKEHGNINEKMETNILVIQNKQKKKITIHGN